MSHLFSKVLNGSTTILTTGLLKFAYSVGRCGAHAPTPVFVVLNGRPANPEPSTSFKHSVWLPFASPNACLIIVRVSVALFPSFAQNLSLFL
jgi:hypothetical protein